MSPSRPSAKILYDGECPFCTSYVRRVRLKKNIDVTLIDARQETTSKETARRYGYDLDQGMLLEYGGNFYQGAEAMHMLSLLSTPVDVFNRLMIRLFTCPKMAAMIYPVFVFMRRFTLRLLGRGKINNLKGI